MEFETAASNNSRMTEKNIKIAFIGDVFLGGEYIPFAKKKRN